MANDSLSIDVKFKDSQAVSGAKKVKVSLDDIKRADGSLNWDGLKKGATSAEQSQGRFSALAVTIGNLASGAITGAISKCKELAAEVVEIGSNFETSMSKVSALSGAQGEELGKLEAKARELGASTTFSASQAADALGYMALAGWDTQQMLDGVGSALTLAQAGEMDLAAASDLLTDYLSAFNMQAADAARMSDVLAYAQANANTTVEGLSMAFKNCAANANAAGMDVETTSAAIAMMANQGLKGSEAGTALNAVLRDMTAKMEDGAIAIGEQVIAVMDAEGNYRDFADILAEVEAATNGMGDAEKAAALQSTFTADSIKGLNLLLNAGAGEMSSFRDELYNCAGTAEATAKTMTDNLGGDVAAMNSAFEELALKIYEGLQEPLRDAAQFVTSTAIPALTTLVQNIDKIAPALVGIGAGIAIVKNYGNIMRLAGTAQSAFKKAVDASTASHLKFKTTTTAAGTTLITYNAQTKALKTQMVASEAAAKAQTTAIKAQEVAMKAGSVACRALSTAMKAIAPMAAMTAVVEIAMAIGTAMEASARQAEELDRATSGMAEALGSAESAFNSYSPAADEASAATEAVKVSTDECIASQAALADKTREVMSEAGTNAAVVAGYADTIAELGEKGDLTAEDQARLKTAVELFNDATGNSIAITDIQNGKLSESKDRILGLAAAYKEEAMAEAARELYKEHAKQLLQDQIALDEATKNLTLAQEGLNNETDPSLLAQYQAQVNACQGEVDRLTLAYDAEKAAMDNILAAVESGLGTYDTLEAALESCGLSMQSFGEISEEQISALQTGFDGGLNSIVQSCATQGIAIPTALADSIKANSGLPEAQQQAMFDALVLQMTGGDVEAAAQVLGHDIDEGLRSGIEGSSEMPAEAIGVMSEDVIARAKEAFDSHSPSLVMQQLGTDVDEGLAGGIEGGAERPTGAMTALSESLIATFSGLPDALQTQSQIGVEGVASAITEGQGTASAAVSTLVASVDAIAQGMPGAMQPYAQSGAEGVTASINNEAPNTAHAADAVRSSIDGVWNQMPGDSRNSATKSINEMASGIRASQAVAVSAADTVSKQVADHLSSAKSDARQAGKSMSGEHYKGGIEDGRGAAVSAADTASKHVADHFSSANGDAWWAGRNMASGLANGISAGRSDAVNAARAIARAAVDAAKAEAQIHSPSRVTRQIGQFFSEGLALGILDEEAQPATAAKSVMAGAISNAQAKAPAVLDIDWYARGGRVNGRTAIGIERGGSSPAPASLSQQTAARGSDADLLRELLRALLSIKSDLPHIIAANVPDSLKLNDRELGRMVRSVPR